MFFVPFSLLGTVVVIALIVGAMVYIGIGIVALALFTLVLYQPFRLLKFVPRRQMRFWLSIAMAVVMWLVFAANFGDGELKGYFASAVIVGISLVAFWLIGLDPEPADEQLQTSEGDTSHNQTGKDGNGDDAATPTAQSAADNHAEDETGQLEASPGAEGEPSLKSHPEPTEAAESAGEPESVAFEGEAEHALPTPPEPQDPPEIEAPSPRNKALDEAEAVRWAIFEATQDDGK